MIYKIVIPEKFPGINELIDSNRTNRYVGAEIKRKHQKKAVKYINECMRGKKVKTPVNLHYTFYEENTRRDKDNVSGFAHKIVQDALVVAGVIPNDGWKQINEYSDKFKVDKARPRIELIIEEVN